MWSRLRGEMNRSPRSVGLLLFATGLCAFGAVTGNGSAMVTSLVVAALVLVIEFIGRR